MINLTVNPPLAPPLQINSLPLISSLFQWKKVNTPPPPRPLSIVVGINWQMHITVTANSNGNMGYMGGNMSSDRPTSLCLPHSMFALCIQYPQMLPNTLGGGGGTPHMKGVGMLVVSLRGVNFRF